PSPRAGCPGRAGALGEVEPGPGRADVSVSQSRGGASAGGPRFLLLAALLAGPASGASAHLFMQRDLESLLSQSEFVARVKITAATLPQSEDVPPMYRARVVSTFKGTLPTDIQIIGEGHHPPRYAIADA